MNALRITLATLALAATGIAHASEITNFPLEKSVAARAAVQAAANTTHAQPGELYDGRHFDAAPKTMKSREQVRAEARSAALDDAMDANTVGG